MTANDIVIGALTAWRENRGGGVTGMQSVINVLSNRATRNRSSIYAECVKPWQFSSMTAKNDPELVLYPKADDSEFQQALALMQQAATGQLNDITGGATFYHASSMTKVPTWTAAMEHTTDIAGQRFYR